MKKVIAVLLLAITLASCGKRNEKMDESLLCYDAVSEDAIPITRQQSVMPSPPPPPPVKVENSEVIKKKIIKDGSLGMEVSDLGKSKSVVDSLVKKYNGYYANESLNNYEWKTSYELKIRVPSIYFEKLITELESGDGEITFKEIEARDVTDQFIDLETRLANKRNYLKRYNDLLKKARTIKEILEIEEKIRVIEEEIESTTGRLKYLSDLVDYSTLNLEISQKGNFKYKVEERDKFSRRSKHALSKGWFGFVDFLVFAIKIWPLWIIATIVIYFWRKRRKKRKEKK